MNKEDKLVGKNIYKPVMRVKHQELKRISDDSMFKSVCPECKEGILFVRRDQNTSKLLKGDMCCLCGQRVEYIDFQYSKAFVLLETSRQAHDNRAGLGWMNLCLRQNIQIRKN